MDEMTKMRIGSKDFHVRPGEEVILGKQPTLVKPEYKSKKDHTKLRKLLDEKTVWRKRHRSIVNLENHPYRNGTRIVGFFLQLSKEEQRKYFLERVFELAYAARMVDEP